MFEIGREYLFVTGTTEMAWVGEVVEVSMPAIRVRSSVIEQGEAILNTCSLTFHSATPLPREPAGERASSTQPVPPPWIVAEPESDPLADIIEP